MIRDQESVKMLEPLAREWALEQEAFVLKLGAPLSAQQIRDAERVGVRDTPRVRVLPVDRMPLPGNLQLAQAAQRAQIITEASAAVTIGHGIMIRADRWRDRELMLHQLVHVAQCERCGGLESFVEQYLTDRSTCADFSVGALEDEARNLAREICAAEANG
ncbi:MAG TPA: hypothetical protein VK993_11850 [Chthoniobacterales bacterium]|nr:hypothetical protein [Chthoniobacterales bacterium]